MTFPRLLLLSLSLCLPTFAATHFPLIAAPHTVRADSVTLVWNKPEGFTTAPDLRFEILQDDHVIGTADTTHFTATGLSPEQAYTFTVHAATATQAAGTSTALTVHTTAPARIISVLDHGAFGDGTTLNTTAIQAAIDACPPDGIVHLPAGVFLTGALYLKSHLTLELAEGAVLKGTSNPADYLPFNLNRFEGWEMETHASLLNAGTLDRDGPANITHLRITGKGTISGGGRALYDAIVSQYPVRRDGLRARGRLILLMNADQVEISGVTLEEPPCWLLHTIYSSNLSLHGLTIRSDVHNGDGIDPDSSSHVYIFNSTFNTGDDCIAIKSGKNPEGNVVARPTENVRIFDCTFERGHGISIGSEMSGGVRNVLVEDCVAGPLLHGMQIKATPERGGFVENITVRNCDLQQITVFSKLPYNNDGEAAPTPPSFRNFTFANIDLRLADPAKPIIDLNGFEAAGHRATGLTFTGLRLPAGATIKLDRVEAATFTEVTTADGTAPTYTITRSADIRL